jgi:regulator of protease activity HflC (stomatin/prohibitin superfamily)
MKNILNRATLKTIMLLSFFFMLSGCVIIQPGEVGLKAQLGKIQGDVRREGVVGYNPFVARVITLPVRTVENTILLDIPTKEGLIVKSEVTLLYRINPVAAKDIYVNFGQNYQQVIVLPNFRSTIRDVSARFNAEDFYTSAREVIESSIAEELRKRIEKHGFLVENTLLKSLQLPDRLQVAIENKLKSEQEAQQMEFILQREKREAERKRIEAEGIRDYQQILSEGLSENLIRWYSLEVFKELSFSENAKIIITNGQTPMIISPEGGSTPLLTPTMNTPVGTTERTTDIRRRNQD